MSDLFVVSFFRVQYNYENMQLIRILKRKKCDKSIFRPRKMNRIKLNREKNINPRLY